ncbi:MAG TPA: hypothetical protein PLX89_22375 [Verrucomicrobiota bacterium]|nr:hypothetical protein [Verrucomicrobiales bacterium]HRI15752.1 hypothetical protein [Verrucomicrobiota bacterium]
MNPELLPALYFHTFWTRPQFAESGINDSALINLPDFEAVTWLASALEARRHGRLKLFTDERGLRFIRNVGLEWVYNGGISTELEAIPDTVHPAVFWSAGKLFAWRSIAEPAVSLDPDAICWHPIGAEAPVVILHTEPLESPDYCYQEERYGRFGFSGPEWDWSVEPANAGILSIADPSFAQRYAQEAIRFMVSFSEALRSQSVGFDPLGRNWADAMLFAEQRLVSMLLRRDGLRGAAIGRYDPRRQHLEFNPRCLHLWSTKHFYPRCREARVAYVNHLAQHLLSRFPAAAATLRAWQLDRPLTVESQPPDPDPPFPLRGSRDGHCRLGRIDGTVVVQDANLEVKRPGYPGAVVGVAEILFPEPGTSFELTEMRHFDELPTAKT